MANHFRSLIFAYCSIVAATAHATCWQEAEQAYGIPAKVLKAFAKTESNFNARAIGRNATSEDIGLMQINDSHLPRLKKYGIDRKVLLNDPCINLKVGASILSEAIAKHGYNWNAIGAYNVGCARLSREECTKRRNRYAWRIYNAYASDNRGMPVAQALHQQAPRAIAHVAFGDERSYD